jgi:histone acetyltransferase HTATIP
MFVAYDYKTICSLSTVPAQIIQSRLNENKQQEYYIHYVGLNRRLDQWVTQDRIQKDPIVEPIVPEVVATKSVSSSSKSLLNGYS